MFKTKKRKRENKDIEHARIWREVINPFLNKGKIDHIPIISDKPKYWPDVSYNDMINNPIYLKVGDIRYDKNMCKYVWNGFGWIKYNGI